MIGVPKQGVVYTSETVVSACLDMAGYNTSDRILGLRTLDVGCGYGQFIGEIARRKSRACRDAGFSREQCIDHLVQYLRGVEVDKKTSDCARQAVLDAVEEEYPTGDEDDDSWSGKVVIYGDFLDSVVDSALGGSFDFITGNLPYVRYKNIENLPCAPKIEDLRKRFDCFRGRCDYSVAFMEKLLGRLTEGGEAAVITSNAFTRANYGAKLREKIVTGGFGVDELDFANMPVFEEKVNAYASLFVVKKEDNPKWRLITMRTTNLKVFERLSRIGFERAQTCSGYRRITRSNRGTADSPWAPIGLDAMRIIRRVINRYQTLEDEGFVVRKGPATGADKVFIRPSGEFPFNKETSDEYLRRYERAGTKKSDEEILSVYRDGELIELEDLPVEVRRYLESEKSKLEARFIVREGKKKWWSTIDKVDFKVAEPKKVLIPDYGNIRGDVHMDGAMAIPGHSVVYVTHDDEGLLKSLCIAMNHPLISLIRLWKAPPLRGTKLRCASTVVKGLPAPSTDGLASDPYGLSESELSTLKLECDLMFHRT